MSSQTSSLLLAVQIIVILQVLVVFPCTPMPDDMYEREVRRPTSEECRRCVLYNDADDCDRCVYSKLSLPYHTAKREYSIFRSNRASGCTCCAHSRDTYCCNRCKGRRGIY